MNGFTRYFLSAFFLDGLFSVADEWVGHQWEWLTLVRASMAMAVFLLALIVCAGMFITPRLPKRVLALPVAFTLWCGFFAGFPVGLWAPEDAGWMLSAFQLALAIGILGTFGKVVNGRWTVFPQAENRPFFSLRNLLVTSGLAAVTIAIYGVIAMQGLFTVVEQTTGGYVRLSWSGLSLEERHLVRGNEEVRLVGMMHIASPKFYESIVADLPKDRKATVLMEGISDRKDILKNKFSYSRLAKWFGVSSQEDSSFTDNAVAALSKPEPQQVEYRLADVDVSSFDPRTIAFIAALGALFQSSSFREVLDQLKDPKNPINNSEAADVIWEDILHKRNSHLLSEIASVSEPGVTVIVPWGAQHLPELQKSLEEQGFQESFRTARPALGF